MIRELFKYKAMIFNLVKRDLTAKYKRSFLGFLWTMIDPLLQMIVYTFVFTVILPMGIENYYIHLFVALIPWTFFSSCLSGGAMAIINQQDMVKKIYFPREVLPIAYATSQFISMALSFVVVFIVLLASGVGINGRVILWLFPVMIIQYILCVGVTILVSGLTVFFRDLQMILNVASMALLYCSPVIYPIDRVPPNILPYYMLNPMSGIITAYRDILYFKKVPDLRSLGTAAVISLALLLFSFFLFGRLKRRFVEEL